MVTNPPAGFSLALRGSLTGLQSMPLGKVVTYTSSPWLLGCWSPYLHTKTELIVRGLYGAGKTQRIALLAAFFAL